MIEKTAIKNITAKGLGKMKKNIQLRLFSIMAFLIILFSSCSGDNAAPENPGSVNTLACKMRPGHISFGQDTSDIIYNIQDKPIKITTTSFNPAAPGEPPVKSVYTIEYNAQGNADKVFKLVDNQDQAHYALEYNSSGKLIKQSQFNPNGILTSYTTAQYNNQGLLTAITTYTENTSVEVTTVYQYENGNLIKKSIHNLYNPDSQEYYNADYSYSYFPDKENKIKPYFQGPLGLLFISDLSKKSLQYLPDASGYQLFYAQETSFENKMLKNIEIIAHRYNTRDTANIDYSYDYDAEGFPTVQRGSYKNIIRRYVPTPFGGSVFLVTPVNKSEIRTINFSCN